MILKRLPAWLVVSVGGGTLAAGCGLVAGLDKIADSQLVPVDGGGPGADVHSETGDDGPKPDVNVDAGSSWCSRFATANRFQCYDFDQSNRPITSPNQNNCVGSIAPASLGDTQPNLLKVLCDPIIGSTSKTD